MENSIEKERRKRTIPAINNNLFQKAISGIKKDTAERPEPPWQKFRNEQKPDSKNLNSPEKTSNELTSVHVKQPSPCQENFSLLNDKPRKNRIDNSSDSRQSVDRDHDVRDMNTSRNFRSYVRSNSGEYVNAVHDSHNKKSNKFSGRPKSNDFSVNSTCVKTNQYDSTSKHSEPVNIYQHKFSLCNDKQHQVRIKSPPYVRQSVDKGAPDFIERMPRPKSHNNSKDSCQYPINATHDCHTEKESKADFVNNDSFTSNLKQPGSKNILHKNVSKNSNFRNLSYHLSKKHYNSNTKNNDFRQNHDSNKESLSRSIQKYDNSNHYIALQEDKFSYKLDQSVKVDDGLEKDVFFYNLNNFEENNTEINYQRSCLKLNETLKNSDLKNIQVTCKRIPKPAPNESVTLNSSSVLSISNAPVSPILNVSTPSISSNVFVDESLNSDNLEVFSSNDDFIPPPTPVSHESSTTDVCSSAEKHTTLLQNGESESTGVSCNDSEAYFSLPDSTYLEAISNFVAKIVKKRSVSSSVADRVVNDLHRLFKMHIEGSIIECYGSYFAGLAITTSNINLMIQSDSPIKKGFMYEIHKMLSEDLEKYHVLQFEEGNSALNIKINFTHPETGINCELAYLGKYQDKYLKMGKFLKAMCQTDQRVKPLIIVTKVWAEHFHINEVEDGQLHPIGFVLLVIHFLQHCDNPILPIYSEERDMKDMIQDLSQNDSCIGTLWLGFLWYYSFRFNWIEDILTVTSAERVSKKSNDWQNVWIAIQDPFTGKNIAAKVINKDVADHIKSCFRQTYHYFLNGQEKTSDTDESQSTAESDSSQLEFSFYDCVVEQNDDYCEMCEETGDICNECQKKISVQPLVAVPKMTDNFLKVIRKALLAVCSKYMLSDEEVEERRQFVKNLESDFRKVYPDAQLSLFGSSANGFGFKKSDLDICMKFKSKNENKPVSVLRNLRTLLRKKPEFINVIAIFNAQIPILKFQYKPHGWRGDISLNNVLAVHNSQLLYTYSLIDKRCKILGCALKLIAKKALIAEVTEKALSSYSYLIMVIHFLQQTDPPVLPVLQDIQYGDGPSSTYFLHTLKDDTNPWRMFRDNYELDDIVENSNVWFCKNMNKIKAVFKTDNNVPVEQLFLELLDYYCSFDVNHVITIRQKEILSLASCKNMSSARLFNIQDPFLVDKNLGRVVSHSKAQETKSVFNKARILFRVPNKEMPTDLENHFFSTMNLTGRILKEVLCEICGKFGHDQKDCTQSSFLKKNFFFRKNQYTNQNKFFKRKQINSALVKKQ